MKDLSKGKQLYRHVAKIFFRMHLTIGKSCVYLQPEIGVGYGSARYICPTRSNLI